MNAGITEPKLNYALNFKYESREDVKICQLTQQVIILRRLRR